jgi:PLP dependent protein
MITDLKKDTYTRNVEKLKNEIGQVCKLSGRNPDDILIVAAAKYADGEQLKQVMELGINHFGENRAEELLKKYDAIGDDAIWHFIGHLQSRKVKIVVPLVEYIHSIDSLSTLEKINEEAYKNNKVQKVLIEINISREDSKFGIYPENLEDFLMQTKDFNNIKIAGLMTMAPLTDDFGFIRIIFKKLRILMETFNEKFKSLNMKELSMGMSNDFKIAIEEGATMIRVGSSIFI